MACGIRALTPQQQRGQALVESLIGSLLLIPLFLGVRYVGLLQVIHLDTAAGLREAALVSYAIDDSRATGRALEEIFSRSSPSLADIDNHVETHIDEHFRVTSIDRVQSAVEVALVPVSLIASDRFELAPVRATRLMATTVIEPASWSGIADLVPQSRSEQTLGVLVGAGAASSRAQVIAGIRGLSPVDEFASIADFLRPLRSAITLLEPSFERFCPGRIDPDIVPADRLSSSSANDLRNKACD